MSTTTPSRPLAPARRRARRLAAKVVSGLATPLVGADYLDLIAPLRHASELRAKVVAIRQETPDAVTLELRPGRDWDAHLPGQHARIGVEVDGVRLWRTYSITSMPVRGDEPGARLSITVRCVPFGAVSTQLTQHTRVGDLLWLGRAGGDFVAPAPGSAGLLFIAGGSGITPVIGMLRSGLTGRDIVVVHSSRTLQDAIFGDELRGLARKGRITLFERHTATAGRLTASELLDLVPDAFARETFACGPAGLVRTVQDAWDDARAARLHTETFHTPVIAAGRGGSAVFCSSGVTVATRPGQSLLDAGEAAGVLLPSGCRQGICFGCVRPLVAGSVQDLRTGAVTHAAEGDGVSIQTCISTSAGTCRIDG